MFIHFLRRGTGIYLFLVFLLSACEQAPEALDQSHFVYTGGTMGTSFSIKASPLAPSGDADAIKQQVDELLVRINQQMSTYIPDSELSLFNSSRNTEWREASPALLEVLQKAQEVHGRSLETFDVTVGPLVNLWGFGPELKNFTAPDPSDVQRELARIGSDQLLLDMADGKLKKGKPDLMVDLSALAKGYAVDRVALLLEQSGFDNYMVEIGGEIRLKGRNFDGQLWRIAIEKPTVDQRVIQRIEPLTDISMATSGDYRNYFEENGIRYSHTIDPRTGYPIKHSLASVTVLSQTCMDADAWATALMVLGPEEGYQIAEQEQLAAYFIIKSEQGFVDKMTPMFAKINEEQK